MNLLRDRIGRWLAPVSLAIFAPGADFDPTVQSIRYLRDCLGNNLIKEYVTFHVFFSYKHMPPQQVPPADSFLSKPFNCSETPPYKKTNFTTYMKKNNLLYPVNVARNIARDAALTHFVLASDIELYPSPNLIPKFLNMIARNEGPLSTRTNPRVFTLTLFEVAANAHSQLDTKVFEHGCEESFFLSFRVGHRVVQRPDERSEKYSQRRALTHFVLASDIELYPSPNLIPKFLNMIARNEGPLSTRTNPRVFTLTLFEVAANAHVSIDNPSSKYKTSWNIPRDAALTHFDLPSDIELYPSPNLIPKFLNMVARNLSFFLFVWDTESFNDPMNVARNIARDAALTHFVLASDIELYPSPNLIPKFLNMIARNEGPLSTRTNPRVFTLTLFEVAANAHVSIDNDRSSKYKTSWNIARDVALTHFNLPFDIELYPSPNLIPKFLNMVARNLSFFLFVWDTESFNDPMNVARNIARDAALTHFVLASDIELYPSPNLIPKFLNMIARNEGPLSTRTNPRVFTLTLFEVAANAHVPSTKTELQQMLSKKTAIPFHKFVCPSCHNIPQAQQWMNAKETNQMSVFHVGKRRGKHVSWEPIYIGTHQDPYYDERLSWEGKKDKMTQGYVLCVKDYDFMILNNAFLIHKPGIKRYQKEAKRDTLAGKQGAFVRSRIGPELKKLYGTRAGCAV
ncbi:glycosyl-transferase for dystroglycan domain-containing protein [Phthorimaea operculella]|nr:glycosyl-transferase for dystroglycan domain-containing protein [Phthorimaea operculella]